MEAVVHNYEGGVKYLIECGANLSAHNNDGLTALDLAESRNYHALVQLLQEQTNMDRRPAAPESDENRRD